MSSSSTTANNNNANLSLPPDNVTRYTLTPESELRIEIPSSVASSSSTSAATSSSSSSTTITLRQGSVELFGAEIPLNRPIPLSNLSPSKIALFTWHGCIIDISSVHNLDMIYESDETDSNVVYVNTHAQLEVMRDEALMAGSSSMENNDGNTSGEGKKDDNEASTVVDGPRVLLVGPADCGKSSLARVLTAYAVKLGRTPLLVDIDVSQNMLSVPGTVAAIPVSSDMVNAESYGTTSIFMGGGGSSSSSGGANANAIGMPLVLWYGSQDLLAHPDLYKAQLTKLGNAIDERLRGDSEANASGFIVNTSGLIEDVGYQYLLHAIDAFRINIVLVLGHDRLYSMLGTYLKKQTESLSRKIPKLIKLPRSGGVVSRDATFRRALRSQSIKRYFYGGNKSTADGSTAAATASSSQQQYQFNPCLIEVSFSDMQLHKLSNISLSASLLPISAKQSTDPIQLTTLSTSEITTKLQQTVLAVCHPAAVEKYEESGSARDLYLSGVAGFVVVEKVDTDKGVMSLLSPCVGSLPSSHLLVGDIFWLE